MNINTNDKLVCSYLQSVLLYLNQLNRICKFVKQFIKLLMYLHFTVKYHQSVISSILQEQLCEEVFIFFPRPVFFQTEVCCTFQDVSLRHILVCWVFFCDGLSHVRLLSISAN